MDNALFTVTNDFSFSTEADYDCFYENETLYSNDTSIEDDGLGNTENKAMFIMIYGLGGLLVFSSLYSICTAYYFHVKEYLEDDREERHALAEYQERQRTRVHWPSYASSPSSTPPLIGAEYISEEMRDMLDRNPRPKQVCQNREQSEMRSISHESGATGGGGRGYISGAFRDMLQLNTRAKQAYQNREQIELRPVSHDSTVPNGRYTSEEIREMLQRNTRPNQLYQNYEQTEYASQHPSTPPESERRFYPEDFLDILQPNTVPKQIYRSSENIQLGAMSSASSTPPITERTIFYEDFRDISSLNAVSRQVDQSFEEIELRSWTYNSPTPSETERIFFPEDFLDILQSNTLAEGVYKSKNEPRPPHIEINMSPATPERIDTERPSLIERKSKSSPCSPNIVRRRLHALGESPRRPSSWRT